MPGEPGQTEQAGHTAELASQASMAIQTGQTAWPTSRDDKDSRAVPTGRFDRASQPVQRSNPVSPAGQSEQRAGWPSRAHGPASLSSMSSLSNKMG